MHKRDNLSQDIKEIYEDDGMTKLEVGLINNNTTFTVCSKQFCCDIELNPSKTIELANYLLSLNGKSERHGN